MKPKMGKKTTPQFPNVISIYMHVMTTRIENAWRKPYENT